MRQSAPPTAPAPPYSAAREIARDQPASLPTATATATAAATHRGPGPAEQYSTVVQHS